MAIPRAIRATAAKTSHSWAGVQALGPTEVDDEQWAALLRAPLDGARDLVRRVKHAAAIRSARKERGMLSVTVDPETLG